MDKQILLSTITSGLKQLGIPFETGQNADIAITCEFLDSGWSTGNKKITYQASIFADETSGTIYMWELTTEKGSGISFGGDSESSFQTGATLYRKVKSIQYGLDGKAYEINLNLGSIPKTVKEAAKTQGWKFKTVLKKEKASYPANYTPRFTPLASTAPVSDHKENEEISGTNCAESPAREESFCQPCESSSSNVAPSSPEEKTSAAPIQNQDFFSTEANAPKKQIRFGKTITVLFSLLITLIIGMFWLMDVSFVGWAIAIVVLAALYLLSGKVSQKGCLPLIFLWLIAIVALFLVFIFSPNGTPSTENSKSGSASVSKTDSPANPTQNVQETQPQTQNMQELFSAVLDAVKRDWKADAKISHIWTIYISEDFHELQSFTPQHNWNVKFYSPSSNTEIDVLLRYEFADQNGLPGILYFCKNASGEEKELQAKELQSNADFSIIEKTPAEAYREEYAALPDNMLLGSNMTDQAVASLAYEKMSNQKNKDSSYGVAIYYVDEMIVGNDQINSAVWDFSWESADKRKTVVINPFTGNIYEY